MPLSLKLSSRTLLESDSEVIALGVTESPFDKQKALVQLDEALDKKLLAHAARTKFTGGAGQVLDAPSFGRLPSSRVVLVGMGKTKRGFDAAALRTLAASAARQAINASSLTLLLPEKATGPEALRAVGEGVGLGAYRFTKYLTGKRKPETELGNVEVTRGGKSTPAEAKSLQLGLELAGAVSLARDAVNEPPNELTPEGLAEIARGISKRGKLKLKVLDKKGIEAAGMKLHYAVGQGSSNEPRFIHLTYSPAKPKAKLAFVGKGLTFDSGGLCIKPAQGMGEMKSDMGGAAAVLALAEAVALLKPAVEVHVIVGAAENMPDGSAYRPGDVFGSLDGKTVEIINTDAEGRLVLADALAYARKLEPDLIVDAATLTGACLVALGKGCSAFYVADPKMAKRFEDAAELAGEQFWRLPLIEELREQLKSDIADLKHTGERYGGSITAALFLQEFVGDTPWIHCDVAGPVLADRPRGIYPKGATGHPVLTFVSFVESFG
ncbi:MAG TPA: leucyl aminopeptidase [Polyangiaceae bacterium]|nr:leucyl aminopeptidase [Polyangiaceae bacterium]